MILSDLLIFSTSGIVIIILVVLVITLFIVYIQKQKAVNALHKQNKVVITQKEEIENKNHQLREQNKELVALNEEKNNIIGIVSHDLKAPLNRIFALANLLSLSGENLNEEQKDYLNKMSYVVKDGLDLIRNLLDIRTIEHKGITLNVETVNVVHVLDKIMHSYEPSIAMKNQKLVFKRKGSRKEIESDRLYLNRIFDNLISNATKFSQEGVRITVKFESKEDHILVCIEDQGPGLSEDDQKQLFKKFQILSPRPTGGESSTGLGLSIVKSLVEILQGKVYCESALGKGSKFFIELPYQIPSSE